jgi:superfamily II DNA or RNA helicase
MKALEEDKYRNILITGLALEEALKGNTCIVLSKRKKHLENMAKEIQSCIKALCEEWDLKGIKPAEVVLNALTGDNSFDYSDIKNDIESYECGSILFSTLAEEGTDIPKLDRLFLTYPARKLRGVEQSIGRIMRPYPGKKDAIVYDFRDKNVSLLNNQYRFRAQGIYHKNGYEVEKFNE